MDKQLNRRIGRAMHDYDMLADGDSVLLGLSGGIDSLFLLWVMEYWQKKAPISYRLEAVHVDMEGEPGVVGEAARAVQQAAANIRVPLTVIPASWKPPQGDEALAHRKDLCFRCAKSRRVQLFEYAREFGFSHLALGHHRDDIIETFFLNLTCAGNISTMRPKQELFGGNLSIIRPLSYCDKADIEAAVGTLGLVPVRTFCPLSEKTRRQEIHDMIQVFYERIPGAKKHIFSALGNVRADYLLSPGAQR